MNILPSIIALLAAYLIGSIPAAYLAGRLLKGFDIRKVGSRNMGSMNVFYSVGFWPGLLVLVVDIGKGALAVALAHWLGAPVFVQLLAGALSVIGHSFPIWLHFRGGKGGATCIGVLIYVLPWGIPFYAAAFGLLLAITRFPTLSYSVAFVVFPIVAWLTYHNGGLVAYSILILFIPGLQYIPRIKEQAGGGRSGRSGRNWRQAIFRKSLKDRR